MKILSYKIKKIIINKTSKKQKLFLLLDSVISAKILKLRK